jgi:hypothetical protein
MKSNLTLDSHLITDLPILEVFNNGEIQYYKTDAIIEGEISFVNVDDEEDEIYIGIKELLPQIDIGNILNFDDYFDDLKEASVNQEVLDYQSNKRISDYNY